MIFLIFLYVAAWVAASPALLCGCSYGCANTSILPDICSPYSFNYTEHFSAPDVFDWTAQIKNTTLSPLIIYSKDADINCSESDFTITNTSTLIFRKNFSNLDASTCKLDFDDVGHAYFISLRAIGNSTTLYLNVTRPYKIVKITNLPNNTYRVKVTQPCNEFPPAINLTNSLCGDITVYYSEQYTFQQANCSDTWAANNEVFISYPEAKKSGLSELDKILIGVLSSVAGISVLTIIGLWYFKCIRRKSLPGGILPGPKGGGSKPTGKPTGKIEGKSVGNAAPQARFTFSGRKLHQG